MPKTKKPPAAAIILEKEAERDKAVFDASKLSITRSFEVREANLDEEARTVELAFSSDTPIYHYGLGFLILDHTGDSMKTERLLSDGPLLFNHNWNEIIGKVVSVSISDGVGRALVQFSRKNRAEEFFQDVKDGILRSVSVGFGLRNWELESETDGVKTYRSKDWEPYEISLVSVPADTSVGVGRSFSISTEQEEQRDMENNVLDIDKAVESAVEKRMAEYKAENEHAAKAERDRVAHIFEVATHVGAMDEAKRAVEAGEDAGSFSARVLAQRGLKPISELPDTGIGLNESEAQRFSISKAILARANQDWSKATYERDIIEAERDRAAKDGRVVRDADALLLPDDVLRCQRDVFEADKLRRELNAGSATQAGNLIGTNLMSASFVELLRNATVMASLGVFFMDGLVGNVKIPRQTAGGAAYWLAESGAVTEANLAVDQISMSPKTLAAHSAWSQLLLAQSTPAIDTLVMMDIANVLGLAMDLAMITGTGASNQPTGILNLAGTGLVAMGTNGAVLNWDKVVELETKISSANALVQNISYVTNSKVVGQAKTTLKAAGVAGYIMEQGQMNGYNVAVTNQVPSNLTKGTASGTCSAMLLGNFRDFLVGRWGGLELLVDPYTGAGTRVIKLFAHQLLDMAGRHPESFGVIKDIVTG